MKRIIAFLFLIAAASCIDPYTPNLKNYNSLLVVEGLITNENSSYKIKLSRTTGQANSISEKVADADVYIIDGSGVKTHLQNSGGGYYKTDSTLFKGVVGQNYTLQILTGDGKEYKSGQSTMLPVADIDKVYYEKGEEISGINGKISPGLKIFLNSANTIGNNQYFRWTFEEVWKFKIPCPQRYICKMVLDKETYIFEQIDSVREYCWKRNLSEDLITNSILSGGANFISGQEIQFIDPVLSDRLTQEYSILVKQYSVSQEEFDFWNNLKKAGEAGGDIFALQPFTVMSNIHNVNNNNERVLGYFEVSGVSQKRIFITAHELDPLSLTHYQTDCVEIPKGPSDWPGRNLPTFYQIYYQIMNNGDYTFIRPIFNTDNTLRQLVYATNVCAICELTGFSTKPDFWIDLNY
jgi:hypothetical protein